jgi:hypothetical protein
LTEEDPRNEKHETKEETAKDKKEFVDKWEEPLHTRYCIQEKCSKGTKESKSNSGNRSSASTNPTKHSKSAENRFDLNS